MIITHQPTRLREVLDRARRDGATVGAHPTMGSLHAGHQANIRRAAAECSIVAVTIFVNPLQFGPDEDFEAYPRSIDEDLARAEEAGASVVFCPAAADMFPLEPLTRVKVGRLGQSWEGQHRPGHFDGVATIVVKLLNLVGPCYAYFGEKDYQQLAVVSRVVDDLSLPVVVVPCPTVREPDGLALSSRNKYLSAPERSAAPVLYWSLLAGKRAVEEDGATDGARVARCMSEVLASQALFEADYVGVVDPVTLEPLSHVPGRARLLVAARCPSARLIDNLMAGPDDEGSGD